MSNSSMPSELQTIRVFLPEMIHRLESVVPYASALVTQESGTSLRLDSHRELVAERQPRRGIVFTLFNGRFFQEWATDNLDQRYLDQKIIEMCRMFQSSDVTEPRFFINPGEIMDRHYTSCYEIDPDDVKLTDMVEECRHLIKRLHELDNRVVNTSINYHDSKEYKMFFNRSRVLSSALTTCSVHLVTVGADKGSVRMNFISKGGVTGFEIMTFSDEELHEMLDDLNRLFMSKSLDPGIYEVISTPQVSGILAHEAFGHGVEADMIVKERARASQYLGRKVASPLVSMIDDPSIPGLNGHYFFDDEGEIAVPTMIIENGVLRRVLTDLRSASVLNLPRSSNGRRESFERKVYSRMSNTYFCPGSTPVEDMVGSIDRGLLLKKSSSGMEDPKGWGIQVGIDLAQEIRNGRITDEVYAPLTMTGYIPDMLNSITQVGDSLGFMDGGGSCGKGHKEMVRVSAGGPHLRFKVRLG
ncbi:TldD/PmbA family protein [bacterium]|nr:TldD/PmbA family protein [candidate division CSSED10-310 bacterium]